MSTTLEPTGTPAAPGADSAIKGAAVRAGDRVFSGLSRGAGVVILLTMAAIAVFLIWRAIPSLQANTANFFTTQVWFPDQKPAVFGIAALAFGTLMTSVIAMLLAVPVGIGVALFISHYATRRLAATLAFITDLLAAVPSIIFGLLGLAVFINLFGLPRSSALVGGMTLALMTMPVIVIAGRNAI